MTIGISDLSAGQLKALKTRINKRLTELNNQELKRVNAESKNDNVVATIDFGGYNQKRYGKPWIAKVVSWSIGRQPKIIFGAYYGNANGGYCEIDACIGDTIKWGQKDYRGGNTESKIGIVGEFGKVKEMTITQARNEWKKDNLRNEI